MADDTTDTTEDEAIEDPNEPLVTMIIPDWLEIARETVCVCLLRTTTPSPTGTSSVSSTSLPEEMSN